MSRDRVPETRANPRAQAASREGDLGAALISRYAEAVAWPRTLPAMQV